MTNSDKWDVGWVYEVCERCGTRRTLKEDGYGYRHPYTNDAGHNDYTFVCKYCEEDRQEENTIKTWTFTVERDIPIQAHDEEEAEKLFHKKYGNIPVLGIIRPWR